MISHTPMVSIVIPVFNGSDYLENAITSVLRQTYKNIELIVVNDGSTDKGKTASIAMRYKDRLSYYEKDNVGTASALNYGISMMKGDYFVWLSHDDEMDPQRVEEQIADLMRYNLRIAVCSGRKIKDNRTIGHYIATQDDREEEICTGLKRFLFDGGINMLGIMIDRTIFDEYGTFDESLETTQDSDFLFRILRNERYVCNRHVLFTKRIHDAQGTQTNQRFSINSDMFYAKCIRELSEVEGHNIGSSKVECAYRLLLKLLFRSNYNDETIKACLDAIDTEEYRGDERTIIKSAWLYGSGFWGRQALFDMRCRQIEVNGFIDCNTLKQGSVIDGMRCYSLSEVDSTSTIIISAKEFVEIKKRLDDYGVSSYYWYADYGTLFNGRTPNADVLMNYIKIYREKGWIA